MPDIHVGLHKIGYLYSAKVNLLKTHTSAAKYRAEKIWTFNRCSVSLNSVSVANIYRPVTSSRSDKNLICYNYSPQND